MSCCPTTRCEAHDACAALTLLSALLCRGYLLQEEYLKYGAGDLKKWTPLTPSSVFAKAALYYQLHARGDRNTVTFQQLLLEMMRTGRRCNEVTMTCAADNQCSGFVSRRVPCMQHCSALLVRIKPSSERMRGLHMHFAKRRRLMLHLLLCRQIFSCGHVGNPVPGTWHVSPTCCRPVEDVHQPSCGGGTSRA
jgi:hypothetical protein